MSIDAMKQALEALELHGEQYPHMQKGYTVDAITALRLAIEQAERGPVVGAKTTFEDGELVVRPLYHDDVYTASPQQEKQEPVANEMPLHIIRKWPEGFQERLQHVWLDVVSFIPEVKLWDLQRTLAEFGFTMKVYDGAAPPQRQPLTKEEIRKLADTHLFYQTEGYEVSGVFNLVRSVERKHGIGENK